MRKQVIISLTFIFIVTGLFAQTGNDQHQLSIQSNTLFSSGDQVPFWLQMNQLGIFDDSDPFQQLFLLKWNRMPAERYDDQVQLTYGATILGRLSEHSIFRPNEYWARLHFKKWYFHTGAKSEAVFANGLSLTNGNLFLSNNARPLPRAEFGTQNFQFFNEGWLNKFTFDFQYAEYFLLDDRYVEDAGLHHKRLDVTYPISPEWSISAGLDHWVFWGGTVPARGSTPEFKMPGFEDYFRYVLGKSGSNTAPSTDQMNVAGNQLGQYMVTLSHDQVDFHLKFYWQHLWEDRSGMQLENAPDGLWGIFWQQKAGKALLESMLLEYVNTRDQSGKYHKAPDPENPGQEMGEGRDNYFNHGIYRSGFVSYSRTIGIPLMIPRYDENGLPMGFDNTRFWALHHGMNGWLSDELSWKTMLTYSRHYGLHGAEYPSPKQLLSLAAQVNYSIPEKPIRCSLKLAYDKGSVMDSAFGAEFSISFRLK